MKERFYSFTAGLFAFLLGCSVIIGLLFKIPALVQIITGFVGMVLNSAMLFALIGFTLMVLNLRLIKKENLILYGVGFFVLVYASLSFSQDVFNYTLGIDQWLLKPWLLDPNPTPGRMAPNTALGFIFSGLTLILIPHLEKKSIAIVVPFLIFLIFMIALIGLLVYSLKLEYIFSWYRFTRMALNTATGFTLVSLGLWTYAIQNERFHEYYAGNEEKRIILSIGAVLISLTLITGLGSIAIITYSSMRLIHQSFGMSLQNKVSIFENEILSLFVSLNKSLHDAVFFKILDQALQKNNLPEATQNFELLFSDDFSASKIVGENGEILLQEGTFIESPALSIPLNLKQHSILKWKDGFWLEVKVPIFSAGKMMGYFIGETRLPSINKIFFDYTSLGRTGENVLCGRLDRDTAICFPSRLHPEPFQLKLINQNHILPMYYALNGISGTDNNIDYRSQRVIAAYRPVDQMGIGFVTKIDAQEIYYPLHRLLSIILPSALLLLLIGLFLLRWQVLPLVKKVVHSELAEKQAKKALQKSEERYEVAVISSNTGLWDWDIQQNYFYISPLIKKMLGYEDKEFANNFSLFTSHLHPEDAERVVPLFIDINKTSQFTVDYRLRKKSGEYSWFQTIGQTLLDASGKPAHRAGSILDINDRKKIEAIKNEFISVVSHELRTPLTSIRGALCLILSKSLGGYSDKIKKLLDIANNNCERLINLINDILDIEKIESGKIKINLKPISIIKVVEEAIAANQMFAQKFKVTLELIVPEKDFQVRADWDRLIQVLNNLISNAIKFSPPGERVEIIIVKNDDFVRVEICDKGKGIPEEFKKRIFQKFSQADSSNTRKVSGTGLGLSIAKAIIEAMDGHIDFTHNVHNEGKGTIFYFELPLTQQRPLEHSRSNTLQKILICEDDEFQADYIKLMLNQAGYHCDVAYSAQDAENCLKKNSYQALLLDLLLPDKNGIELIKQIRNSENNKDVPIIVTSIIAKEGSKLINGDIFSVVDWLEKPIDFKRLLNDLSFLKSKVKPIILHVEDDADNQNVLRNLLGDGYQIINANTLYEARQIINNNTFDLVILDISLPDGNGIALMPLLAKMHVPIIVFSASEIDQVYAEYVKQIFIKSKTTNEDLVESVKRLLNEVKADKKATSDQG